MRRFHSNNLILLRKKNPCVSSSSSSNNNNNNTTITSATTSNFFTILRNFGARESSGWEPPKGPSKESGPRWTQTIPNEMQHGEVAQQLLKGDELVNADADGFVGNPDEVTTSENYLGEVHEIGSNGKLAAIMAWNKEQKATAVGAIRAGAAYNQIEALDPKDGIVKYDRGSRPGSNSGLYRKWEDEPSLEDLDLSIPQVNCAFIADLLAVRKKEQAAQWGDIDPERRAQNIAEKKEERERERIEKGEKVKKQTNQASYTTEQQQKERDEEDLEDPLDYEEVRNVALHPSDGIMMIDVRTVAEVTSWGTIEGAKVVPMHELWEAFHLAPEEFEDQYGFARPDKGTTLLFFCHHGPRSLMAAQIAHHLGYKSVIHLREGFYEWSKQYFLLCRRWMVHDHTTGINNRRLLEFETAKAIAADVAPEFNEIIEAETELIRIDHSRSVGEKQVAIPESVQRLTLEFEKRRDVLEVESGKLVERLALEASESHKQIEAESNAANDRESKGFDPVLSNVPQLTEDQMDAQDELLRRDYSSEAAKVLRRRKASERTGIPESFMFRRKEQPHGTGR